MKRKRFEMERKKTEIRSAIEELSMFVKLKKPRDDDDGDDDKDLKASDIPLRPFLSICSLIIQVLDKIGPTMAVLRQDIDQNIQKLERLYESDTTLYSNMVEILKTEAKEGSAKKPTSCSKAVLWLTRCVDFTVALLQSLAKSPLKSMEQAVEESYNTTLKPWHGWISLAAFKVALKLVPDNKTFVGLLTAKDESPDSLKEDIESLLSLLVPLLQDVHSLLAFYRLGKLKST